MIERLRVSVVIQVYVLLECLGCIDKKIELDLHTEGTGVVKMSVSCYNYLVTICVWLYIILTLLFLLHFQSDRAITTVLSS